VTALGLFVRWAHLASSSVLIGAFAVVLLAGRPIRPSAARWERGTLAVALACTLAALAAGVAALAVQVITLEGRPGAVLDPGALARVLGATRFGAVWVLREGVLVLLLALLGLRAAERTATDWRVLRLHGLLLGGLVLGASAWAGHAAAVEPTPLVTASVDAAHLVAAGAWIGGLLPVAVLVRMAARPASADARPYAVLAARRFAALALTSVVTIGVTGAWNAWTQVGDVPALLGTPYGRLLLLKLALIVPILALATVNRRRLLPALSGDAETVGRPAMRRLARLVGVEALGAAAVLAVVAWMGVTPPGRHAAPTWPFAFRISWGATWDVPGVQTRLLAGASVLLAGLLGGAVLLVLRRRRVALAAIVVALGAGGAIALPPLAVDAYPTTYRRPPVAFHVVSITAGADRYREACVRCHATDGRDLTGPSTARHTAGDLYWWLTAGIPERRMPGFADRLSDEERWDVVNFLRARAIGLRARALGPTVEPPVAPIVAPDFSYAVGPSPSHALREYRGQRIVLLVLFTLPDSRPRLAQLAQAYETILSFGAEVVAVPMGSERDILKRIGPAPPVFFPVATEGAPEIVRTYLLFAPDGRPAPRHMAFVIDRSGYIRARATARPGDLPGLSSLLTQLEQLNQEPQVLEPAAEHIH
jgi:putative copper resistance protein D